MKTLKETLVIGTGLMVLSMAGAPAQAANINTHGSVCTNYNANQFADLDHLTSGVRNLNAATRSVICSVPRSPLAAGATSGVFYVDGTNTGGASTYCSLYSYSSDGVLLGSTSFTTTEPKYDKFLSLPAAQLPTYAYTSLFCILPPSGNGVLRGVTSFQ